jgi:hypothetical protein
LLLAKQKDLEAHAAQDDKTPLAHITEILPLIAVDSWASATRGVVYAQTGVNQAIAACALERYRIEHGKYPDNLAAANHPGEKPIPLDIISGKPMGYRKTPDGRYLIWCVGFSGLDHGGLRMLDPKDPAHTQFSSPAYKGDWVWSYSPN